MTTPDEGSDTYTADPGVFPMAVTGTTAQLVWRGVWSATPSPVYREGHVVIDTQMVSLWVAVVPNPKREVPGTGDAWKRLGISDLGTAMTDLHAGEWAADKDYVKGDLVSHQGSTYIAKQAGKGHEPPADDYWAVLATKGDTGPEGKEGPQGKPGDTATSGGSFDAAAVALADSTATVLPVTLAPDSQLVDAEVVDNAVKVGVAGSWEAAATVTVTSTATAPVEYTVDAWFEWTEGTVTHRSPAASESGEAGGPAPAKSFTVRPDSTMIVAAGTVVKLYAQSIQLDPDKDTKPSVSAEMSVSLIMRRKKKAEETV